MSVGRLLPIGSTKYEAIIRLLLAQKRTPNLKNSKSHDLRLLTARKPSHPMLRGTRLLPPRSER
jgi:hypothetical protein